MNPQRLAIFGHGYLGQALEAAFTAAGWEVRCASLSGDQGAVACDLGDAASVKAAAERLASPDFLIHCASSGRGGADAYRRVYRDGLAHLRKAFPDVPLLFTSSTSVYGQTDGSVVDEESETSPDRETSRLLIESERLVRESGGIVARLSGIYGPGRSVVLRKFLAGEATMEEDGRRYFNQIHLDDIVRAILHLVGNHRQFLGSIFNVSDSEPLTQRECYTALARKFRRPLPPSVPRDLNRKRGWTHKRVSNARLLATGWQPRYPSFLAAVDDILPTLAL